jgi:hypothetical protein
MSSITSHDEEATNAERQAEPKRKKKRKKEKYIRKAPIDDKVKSKSCVHACNEDSFMFIVVQKEKEEESEKNNQNRACQCPTSDPNSNLAHRRLQKTSQREDPNATGNEFPTRKLVRGYIKNSECSSRPKCCSIALQHRHSVLSCHSLILCSPKVLCNACVKMVVVGCFVRLSEFVR